LWVIWNNSAMAQDNVQAAGSYGNGSC